MKVKMRDRIMGAAIAVCLLSTACSSGGGPKPVPPSPDPGSDNLSVEYRIALEEAASALGTTVPRTSSLRLELPIPDHDSVAAAVSYFSGGRRETIQGSFRRSAPWVPMIHDVLSSYGLPADLAYLPVIESGYRSTLTSSAGAHGMWQFMAPTAREYGLRVDWWVDERADPWKATRAAAHYLSDLYRTFGDWPLALAAYNCGPGRVRRTLEAENATTFWELLDNRALPKETRGYVPTFYATIALAGQPERYGFDLPAAAPMEFQQVDVRGPLSLRFLAVAAGVDEDEIRSLNPDLRHGVVPPGNWPLKVPAGTAATIASRDWYLADSLVKVASYSLRRGEDLESFSRRVGVDPRELRSINGLRIATVPSGTTLWVPLSQTELSARLSHTPSSGHTHVVAAGDTLYSIARRNGITVDELVELNRLRSDHVIHPGDRLLVRSPAVYGTGGM